MISSIKFVLCFVSAAFLFGCRAETPPPVTTATATSGAPAAAPTTAAPTAAPAATASAPKSEASSCQVAQLALEKVDGDAAMQSRAQRFVWKNTSATACALEGVPSVRVLDARGNALSAKVAITSNKEGSYLTPAQKVERVVLAPGGAAWFSVDWSVECKGSSAPDPCIAIPKLGLSAPGQGAQDSGKVVELGDCACGQLKVSPVVAGRPQT